MITDKKSKYENQLNGKSITENFITERKRIYEIVSLQPNIEAEIHDVIEKALQDVLKGF